MGLLVVLVLCSREPKMPCTDQGSELPSVPQVGNSLLSLLRKVFAHRVAVTHLQTSDYALTYVLDTWCLLLPSKNCFL